MTERDWSCWLRIFDKNSGEIFFDAEHCGGGAGWEWWARTSTNHFHSDTDAEMFGAARWVMLDHPTCAVVEGYMKPEFEKFMNPTI
jgi:phage terminase large subunit-like protein